MIMEKEIKSKHNVISIFVLLTGSIGILVYAISLIDGTPIPLGTNIIIMVTLIVSGGGLAAAVFTSIFVTAESIQIKNLWFGTSKHYSWTEFDALWLTPTFFGSYNVGLRIKESQKMLTPMISLKGNHKELAKSIIEASVKANPSIELNGLAKEAYGPPPFGYFD